MRSFQPIVSLDEDTLVDLLKRAQADLDPSAIEGLYLHFANRIFRFILTRIGNREQAEEITSQVFVRLIEKLDLYRISPENNVANFSAWLYRMAQNLMIDVLRASKRTKHTDWDSALHLATDSSLHMVDEELEVDGLLETLRNVSDQQHAVIVLRFMEDFSIAETAQIMQKSEGAVKALQHRALESLRRQLLQ